jgi:predicted RNase H-like HicB family nuclease
MFAEDIHAVVFEDPVSHQWIGMCLEYDVVTQGDSEDHAVAMVKEAVELLMAGESPQAMKEARQPVAGTPVVRRVRVHAPALLK